MIGESARNWQINVQPRIIGLIKYSRVEHWVYGLILGLTHPMHSSFSSNGRTCFSQAYENNTAGPDLKRHEPEKNWSIFLLDSTILLCGVLKKASRAAMWIMRGSWTVSRCATLLNFEKLAISPVPMQFLIFYKRRLLGILRLKLIDRTVVFETK